MATADIGERSHNAGEGSTGGLDCIFLFFVLFFFCFFFYIKTKSKKSFCEESAAHVKGHGLDLLSTCVRVFCQA